MGNNKEVDMELEYEGKCYVVLQTDIIHPIAYHRHDLIWYPETAMTLLDQVAYIPYVKSIVTENAWLIGCYDRENVRLWKDGEWRRPNNQTYGGSHNHITMRLLGISQTIPSTPLDGGEEIRKLKEELEASYKEIKS